MADAAGNYSGGGGGGGVNDWELVSLTASTYAAAPGPVLPLAAHNITESHSAAPAASAAIFMSQHFNLPAVEALISADPNGGREEQEESNPAAMVVDDEACDADDLDIPCPENDRETEMEADNSLTRSSDSRKNLSTTLGLDDDNALLLQRGAISACLPVAVEEEERQATIVAFRTARTDDAASDTTTSVHRHVSAGSDSVITVVNSASLAPDRAVPVAGGAARVAPNKKGPSPSGEIPCEAQAWWNRTFRFLRSNSKESLTFHFIFVVAGLAVLGQRDKLQLRLEFDVDTEKISCAVREPLGQAKLNMLVGGSPVAQG